VVLSRTVCAAPMFKKLMLPLHKQKLIQRLARLAVDGGHETDRTPAGVAAESGQQRERTVRALLAALELDQDSLKELLTVIESGGGSQGGCVLAARRACQCHLRGKCASAMCAAAAMCRHYRWPDLDSECQLRRLVVCRTECQDEICVNPYHWSRVYRPDVPAPVTCAKLRARLRLPDSPDESETVTPESVTTGGTCQYGSISSLDGCSYSTWCRAVYFERRRRVGPVGGWSVRQPVQQVFYSLPHGDGLALDAVVGQNPRPEPDVLRTRPHIGKGLMLSREQDGVWLYNRSERPLFVSSPTLDPADAACAEAVHKLPPGHSLLVFSAQVARLVRCLRGGASQAGPRADLASVTVSFAKGWGPKYSRRSVAECPCWMELWFCGAALEEVPPSLPRH